MSAPRYLERVVLGEQRGLLPWIIRLILWPLSVAYGVGLRVYLWFYASGLRKRHRLPVPVISVGNLTFGGTGKTPAVQMVCRMLVGMGKKPVVLSRGHGGNAKATLVVSDGQSVLAGAEQAGDEPVLLARTLPGIPVIADRDRRRSGEAACSRFKPDVIVLDDGMQYWQLARDLEIVLLDGRRPFGSGLLMPAGDLREPVSGISRADCVIVSHAASLNEADRAALVRRLKTEAPHAFVFGSSIGALGLLNADGTRTEKNEWLEGRPVVAFCGIGRPESFFELLESLGARIEKRLAFPDHHRFSDADLCTIEEQRKACTAAAVTTEKDLARMGGSGACIKDLFALRIELRIEDVETLEEQIKRTVEKAN